MINLSGLLDDEQDEALLIIEPITPVSINESVPSKHVRTADAPSPMKLRGMIENALGLHTTYQSVRKKLNDYLETEGRFSHFKSVLGALSFERVDDNENGEIFEDLRWRSKWRNSDQAKKSVHASDYRMTEDNDRPFPYGKTQTVREYVEATPWVYRVTGPKAFLPEVKKALSNPKAPLYIGDTEGWTEAKLLIDTDRISSSDTDSQN